MFLLANLLFSIGFICATRQDEPLKYDISREIKAPESNYMDPAPTLEPSNNDELKLNLIESNSVIDEALAEPFTDKYDKEYSLPLDQATRMKRARKLSRSVESISATEVSAEEEEEEESIHGFVRQLIPSLLPIPNDPDSLESNSTKPTFEDEFEDLFNVSSVDGRGDETNLTTNGTNTTNVTNADDGKVEDGQNEIEGNSTHVNNIQPMCPQVGPSLNDKPFTTTPAPSNVGLPTTIRVDIIPRGNPVRTKPTPSPPIYPPQYHSDGEVLCTDRSVGKNCSEYIISLHGDVMTVYLKITSSTKSDTVKSNKSYIPKYTMNQLPYYVRRNVDSTAEYVPKTTKLVLPFYKASPKYFNEKKNYVKPSSEYAEKKYVKPSSMYPGNKYVKPTNMNAPKIYVKPTNMNAPKNYVKPTTMYAGNNYVKPTTMYAGNNYVKPTNMNAPKIYVKPTTMYAEKNYVKPSNMYPGNNYVKPTSMYPGNNYVKPANMYAPKNYVKPTSMYGTTPPIRSISSPTNRVPMNSQRRMLPTLPYTTPKYMQERRMPVYPTQRSIPEPTRNLRKPPQTSMPMRNMTPRSVSVQKKNLPTHAAKTSIPEVTNHLRLKQKLPRNPPATKMVGKGKLQSRVKQNKPDPSRLVSKHPNKITDSNNRKQKAVKRPVVQKSNLEKQKSRPAPYQLRGSYVTVPSPKPDHLPGVISGLTKREGVTFFNYYPFRTPASSQKRMK